MGIVNRIVLLIDELSSSGNFFLSALVVGTDKGLSLKVVTLHA